MINDLLQECIMGRKPARLVENCWNTVE